eukprot:gene7430-564_t
MSGKGSGYLKRLLDGATDYIMRKETVGFDKKGNKYFRYFETTNGEKTERREVKWLAGEYWNYDPNDIPSEWRMWLRKLRVDPPTEEELAKSALKSANLQVKVAALDEAERLRQVRMQQQGSHTASAAPDMSRLLQEMKGETPKPAAPKTSQESEPEAWVPNSECAE